MIFNLRDKLAGRAVFSKAELSLILGLYGDHVKKGIWKDYAIDSLPDMAVFSVYKSARENPAYAIAKIPARGLLKSSRFSVFSGNKTLLENASLADVLAFFAEEK